jgi:hypothetical protein
MALDRTRRRSSPTLAQRKTTGTEPFERTNVRCSTSKQDVVLTAHCEPDRGNGFYEKDTTAAQRMRARPMLLPATGHDRTEILRMHDVTIAAAVAIFIATYAVVAVGKIPLYRIDRAGQRCSAAA